MAQLAPDTHENRLIAGSLLKEGKVVAFPTDTLYGLGAKIDDIQAIHRIFEIKGRPSGQGLPILISSASELPAVTSSVPELAQVFAKMFWPGPLTLILPANTSIPDPLVTKATVAVRMPQHQTALELIRLCQCPITGTSANRSGGNQPNSAIEVTTQIGDKVDMVLDGGTLGENVPSTIIDVTVDPPRLIRPGQISIQQLRKISRMKI